MPKNAAHRVLRKRSGNCLLLIAVPLISCAFAGEPGPLDSSLQVTTPVVLQDRPAVADEVPVTEKKADPSPNSSAPDVKLAAAALSNGTDLISADLAEAWGHFSAKEGVGLSDVWKIVVVDNEKHLICFGEPKGFLYTRKQYTNFELTFEWMYKSNPNANSGVLVYTQNEPRLWPTSIQVQLHQPQAGSIFPSGDATSDNTTEASGLAADIGQWNKCKITSIDGQLSVEINDRNAGKISGCQPASGLLALQSEGSETHFRRMILKELPAPKVSSDSADPLASPEPSPVSPNTLKTSPNAAG